jgi:hypothetical protein
MAGYWRTVQLPEARIQALKAAIQADFTGRHAEGEAEAQRKRLTRLEHERAKAKAAYYNDALTLDDFKLEQDRIGREAKAANEAISHWTIEVDAMSRALDEVLSLLTDPCRLYTEAPDGINLMFVQAICEKVWILDTGVVGVDLTAPVAELLRSRLGSPGMRPTRTTNRPPLPTERRRPTTAARDR